jgi:Mg2+ and Co2+ transporter CorA
MSGLHQLPLKNYAWWHASSLNDEVKNHLLSHCKFHALDFEDIVEDTELPKLDEYKYYVFGVFLIPSYSRDTQKLEYRHFGLFMENGRLVTVAQRPVPAIDAFHNKVRRSKTLQKDIDNGAPGYLAFRVLDNAFSEIGTVLRELMREARVLEEEVYETSTRETTKRLGMLRRNTLRIRTMLEPQRKAIQRLADLKGPFFAEENRVYLEELEDTLDGFQILAQNLRITVDSLFEVNETFLAHRTNDTVRMLTLISVALMPPTLLAGYLGMNVPQLPFSQTPQGATILMLATLGGSLLAVRYLISKNEGR